MTSSVPANAVSKAPPATKLALGSILRTANFLSNAVAGLLLTPLIVHSIGDRMYGLWSLVATFIGYYGLLDLGLTSAATRYVSQAIGAGDRQRCNRVFNTALFVYLGMAGIALAATIVLAALSPMFAKQPGDASTFSTVILILGAYTAMGIPLRAFVGTLNADLHYDITSTLDVCNVVLRVVLILVILKLHMGIVALAAVTALSGVPSAVLNVLILHRKLPYLNVAYGQVERSMIRELFSYGAYTFVSQVADIFRFGIDAVVVSAFVGLAAVTHYNIGSSLVQYYISIMLSLLGVTMSVFSQREGARDIEGMKRAFFFTLKISMWSAAFIAFGLIAWGKPFITRWMGAAYIDAYPILLVLTIGCLLALAQMPSITFLFATSKHRFYAVANLCEALANVVLSLVLVHKYGALGVALGTMIPMVLVKLFVQPVYFSHVCDIPLRQYGGRVARSVAFIAVGLAVPTIIAMRLVRPTYPSLIACGALSIAIYAVPFFLLELTPGESEVLARALPGFARRWLPLRTAN